MTHAHPTFPAEGRPVDELVAAMRDGRGDDADWRGGRTFSLVYNPVDPDLERLHEAVAHEYLHENYLNPFAFPSLMRMEREVVAMGADLVHGNPRGGKLTSGGTESLFLAVQVARDHARDQRGIAEPTIVLPSTAHPAFAKACHYLDVTEVRVPVAADGRADLAATAAAIDERTATRTGSSTRSPTWRRWRGSAGRCATSTPASAAGCCRSWSSSASRSRPGTSASRA
jgi:glutamate/tyrosine decarboxylase-like PLP-dependent enzyme